MPGGTVCSSAGMREPFEQRRGRSETFECHRPLPGLGPQGAQQQRNIPLHQREIKTEFSGPLLRVFREIGEEGHQSAARRPETRPVHKNTLDAFRFNHLCIRGQRGVLNFGTAGRPGTEPDLRCALDITGLQRIIVAYQRETASAQPRFHAGAVHGLDDRSAARHDHAEPGLLQGARHRLGIVAFKAVHPVTDVARRRHRTG